MNKSTGTILLAIYLILGGVFALVPTFHFPYAGQIHACIGLVAGIFLLSRR